MGKLKILATGESPQAQSNRRGYLFEELMSDVLRRLGYHIDHINSIVFAGMEIDIEGKSIATSTKLYAECKYYEQEIDAPKVQAFFGKYFSRWLKDKHCQGLFIAIPGLNKTAKGFFEESVTNNPEITLKLKNEDDVIDLIIKSGIVIDPYSLASKIDLEIGVSGEWNILYTDKGVFVLQYIILKGSGIADSIAIFDSKGYIITENSTFTYLKTLYSEIDDFNLLKSVSNRTEQEHKIIQCEEEQIVEVKGSSACFEYQFPAAPMFFVGRQGIIDELKSYVDDVLTKKTSSRGILFEGNSGWGKSSIVLYCVDNFKQNGHFAVAIDSRSATSSQFMIRVVNFVLTKFKDFNGLIKENQELNTLSGFEGAVKELLKIGIELEKKGKILFIILDQFENIFYLPDALKKIRDLVFKINDSQTNIILGFSWKTDLVGLTNDFPYKHRDEIKDSCKKIYIQQFSKDDTTLLLRRLETEIRRPLTKDLQFFLSDFSHGYPWLLKKLCAHVKSQIDNGISQRQISTSLLNMKDLFQADLRGLSAEESDALHRIAQVSPIGIQELGEEFKSDVVASLVHQRLLVKVANKYDVSSDIFREFLNTGNLPVQENYLLRSSPGSVLKALKILNESGGKLPIQVFIQRSKLSEKTLFNVAKDAKLLGLASVNEGIIQLLIELPKQQTEFINLLRTLIKEKLLYNRLVNEIFEELKDGNSLSIDDIAKLLANLSPYISASTATWQQYAIVLCSWLDFADQAIFDRKQKILFKLTPGVIIHKHDFIFPKHHRGMSNPSIQYNPIEDAALRIVDALRKKQSINWDGYSKIKRNKVLDTLESFEFIQRSTGSFLVKEKLIEFVEHPEKRPQIFTEGALKIKSYKIFVEVLNEHKDEKINIYQLSQILKSKINPDWSDSTVTWITKILLNWNKHSNLKTNSSDQLS